jgi:putative endonuclease
MAPPRDLLHPLHMHAPHDLGRLAEDAAAELLARTGWRTLHRNWRSGHREIDLIARRARIVIFVEVKARRSARHGHPLEAIGWRKRRDLHAAARDWIARHGRHGDSYRFDAIWLLDSPIGTRIEHVEGAWTV